MIAEVIIEVLSVTALTKVVVLTVSTLEKVPSNGFHTAIFAIHVFMSNNYLLTVSYWRQIFFEFKMRQDRLSRLIKVGKNYLVIGKGFLNDQHYMIRAIKLMFSSTFLIEISIS